MDGLLFTIFLVMTTVTAEFRFSLDSDRINGSWRVYNPFNDVNVKATVPGGIYSDLQAANIVDKNLFNRFNDQNYRWIANESWTYELIFGVPDEVFKKRINLVFHGADTVADVYLNGQIIGFLNNMFVRHVLPINNYLKAENILQIAFRPPISEARRLAEVHLEKGYPVPPDCPPDVQHGECHINFLRKMQASFSWDWGPAFPSVGLWKSVEIEASDHALIRDITVVTEKKHSKWIVNVTSYFEIYNNNEAFIFTTHIFLSEHSRAKPKVVSEQPGSNHSVLTHTAVFEFKESDIEAWWPNGLGKQKLYRLRSEVSIRNNETHQLEIQSMKEIKFGFREVELVQEKLSPNAEGLSFYFKVNGIPIFAKGSNWIPGHILPELGSHKPTIEHALLSAKEAHMNMIRVWGGGVYESDMFYQMADELGILIWQDLMFAVALYPTDEEFLKSVSQEVEQQVLRLQHHPSIALWAGNNENEAALRGNWFGTASNFDLYADDYVKLYVETIEPIVSRLDSSRWYAVSSPSNGLQSREENHIASNPYSPLYGDIHYYNYIDDPWNSSESVNTRFASEYGFQSMPSILTLSKVSLPEDRKLNSKFTKDRQHHRNGYEEMINLTKYHLPLPDDDGTESFYRKFIYYTQISQAVSIKTLTEKYRRDMGQLTETNEKFTMGALYWQLNDVWEAPSWSSIEFGGKWKMLHYHAVKFFSPVLVSPEFVSNDWLDIYVVSDLLHVVPKATLKTMVYSWDSFEPKITETEEIQVEKARSKSYKRIFLEQLLKDSNCTRTTCFLYFSLTADGVHNENFAFLCPFTQVTSLEPANVKIISNELDDRNVATIEIGTDAIAPFLWFEADAEGHFSDNGFLLLSKRKKIKFHNRFNAFDFERFKNTLKVHSLLTQ